MYMKLTMMMPIMIMMMPTTLYIKETKGARARGLMLSTKIVGFSGNFGKSSLKFVN